MINQTCTCLLNQAESQHRYIELDIRVINIGKFYLRKGAPASAIKRFKFILQNYQNSSVVPETLYRLSEALLIIGLKDESIKSRALLEYNFPKNDWTKLSERLFKNKSELNQKKDTEFSIINYLKDFF